jgi:hypothetical protein
LQREEKFSSWGLRGENVFIVKSTPLRGGGNGFAF